MTCDRWLWPITVTLALVACGAPTEQSTDAVVIEGGPGVASILDTLPERNSEGLDLCAMLPGSEVAEAVGTSLSDTKAETLGVNCSYFVGNSERINVAIKDRMTFDAVRAMAESLDKRVDKLAGMGAAAYTKDSADGDRQVWVVRADGLYLMVQADQQQWAERVAHLALERLP